MDDMATDTNEPAGAVDYQDTAALLEAEIARLEEEVRLRDEALAASTAQMRETVPAPDHHSETAAKVAELTAEIERRDEAITMLLDEIRILEEGEVASKAQWEQLNQWVTQVEERVEKRDSDDSHLTEELDAEQQRSEAFRQAAETDRRAWETQKRELQAEVNRLRMELTSLAEKPGSASKNALNVLEKENVRLRSACEHLNRAAAATMELASVRGDLDSSRASLNDAQAKILHLEDEIERERKNNEAMMASFRSQIAHQSLQGGFQPVGASQAVAAAADAAGSIDERIRAFRQHLQDVHREELEERASKRLASRLSRLWRHTGPR